MICSHSSGDTDRGRRAGGASDAPDPRRPTERAGRSSRPASPSRSRPAASRVAPRAATQGFRGDVSLGRGSVGRRAAEHERQPKPSLAGVEEVRSPRPPTRARPISRASRSRRVRGSGRPPLPVHARRQRAPRRRRYGAVIRARRHCRSRRCSRPLRAAADHRRLGLGVFGTLASDSERVTLTAVAWQREDSIAASPTTGNSTCPTALRSPVGGRWLDFIDDSTSTSRWR